MSLRPKSCAGGAAGFAIIELLVGVLIISFGLLGLITLQGRAVQMSVGNEDAQRAALLANEMASTMINVSTVNLPQNVIDAWNSRVGNPARGGLPNGSGTVTVVNAREARILITWRPVNASATDANALHRYATSVMP